MESFVDHGIRWEWHTACGNCGCESNWHAFDLPEGATMVALPERFPCKGFEFAGCPHDCQQFVFQPAVANVPIYQKWEKVKADARAKLMGEING